MTRFLAKKPGRARSCSRSPAGSTRRSASRGSRRPTAARRHRHRELRRHRRGGGAAARRARTRARRGRPPAGRRAARVLRQGASSSLIMGNVRRGNMYPLCVGAERGLQAQTSRSSRSELGSDTVAHGCTAAGNDQVRFEVALQHARARADDPRAGARPARGKRPEQVKFLRGAQAARAAARRRLLDQPRPLGRDDRRQGDARLEGQHPGVRLGAHGAARSTSPQPPRDRRSVSSAACRSRSTASSSTRSR